jgi:hypothetical protein
MVSLSNHEGPGAAGVGFMVRQAHHFDKLTMKHSLHFRSGRLRRGA